MSPYGWADDGYYGADPYYGDSGYYGAVPIGWWGRDAASINVFYGLLGDYGRWTSYGNYGRVFVPGRVGSGWQPYSRGRWQSDPRYGQMWVSGDPWGWATDHYGRWGHDRSLGWFWVPDTRFGPGWVDWKTVNGRRSWAPATPPGWNNRARNSVARRWINTPDNRDGNRNIRLPQPRPQVTRPDPNREALRPARDSRNARAGNRQNDRPENRAGNRAENRPDTRNVGNGASVRAPGSLSRPPAAAPNRQRPTTGARSPDARPNTARDVRRRSTATMRDQGNRPPQQAGTAPSASNWQSRRAQSGQAQRRRSESQAQRPQQARPHMTRPDQQRHMQGRTAPRPMGQRQARR